MIRNLFGGASKCRTIDKVDIFGDSSGVALYQLDGNANDTGGNYHGTETAITYGGGVYERGKVCTKSTHSYISASSLVLGTTSSISFWAMRNTADADQIVFCMNTDALIAGNYTSYWMKDYVNGFNFIASTVMLPNINEWYHIVLADNGSVVKGYRNGVEIANTASYNSMSGFTFNFIGAYNSATPSLSGMLDQFRVFNRAITATEVATLYAECAPTSIVDNINPFMDGSLKALYKFDGDAIDATGVYNGTATNVTYGTGKFGQCAVFNGSSSKVDFTAISTAKAVSFWTTKAITNGTYKGFFSGTNTRMATGETTGVISGETLIMQGSAGIAYIQSVFNDTTWKHILIQYISDNNYQIYINGIRQTVLYYNTAVNLINTFVTIGNDSGTSWLDASMEQTRFFDKALTPLEVACLYNETTPLEEPMYKLVDPFRDGNGKVLYRLEGNALDESGNYDGTATSVTYGAGIFGRDVVATSGNISIPTFPSFVLGSAQRAVSLWFKHNGTSVIFTTGFGTNNTMQRFDIALFCNVSTGFNNTMIAIVHFGNNTVFTTNTILNDNNWHHVVVMNSGSTTSTESCYIDGVLATSTYTAATINTGSTYAAVLGANAGVSNQAINGLDQVRIFNRALTAGEVSTLYTAENSVI